MIICVMFMNISVMFHQADIQQFQDIIHCTLPSQDTGVLDLMQILVWLMKTSGAYQMDVGFCLKI